MSNPIEQFITQHSDAVLMTVMLLALAYKCIARKS